MRKIAALFVLSFVFVLSGWSQSATNDLLNSNPGTERSDKILLPDVDLHIEDESEIPLKDQTQRLLKDNAVDYGSVNMEELSRAKASDKFKSEIKDERKKEDFSLSAFKFYYGLYQNFIADINIGKRAGNLNYLLTYLRNNRGSTGYHTNTYFNTEQEIDDLNLDLIYSLSTNLDLNAMFGYYVRNNGLYTNTSNLSESKMNIPVRLGALYNMGVNSSLKVTADYDNLLLSHKLHSGYEQKYLWDAGLNAEFEANWSKDNFLKMTGQYLYGNYNSDTLHFGRIRFIDKFPLLNVIALQVGAEVDLYNTKGLFWTPNLMFFYRYSDVISMKFGWYGQQANLSADRYVNENQIDYRYCDPEERWIFLFSVVYSPMQWLKLKGSTSYNAYWNYVNYAYVPVTDLYVFSSVSNIGIIEAEGGVEIIPFENLSVSGSYRLRLPLASGLVFFNYHTASVEAVFRYPDWGFEAGTKITFRDRIFTGISESSYFDPTLTWDLNASQALNKDVFLELKLNNLLNQPVFERPDIPVGGFRFIAGVRILL